MSENKDISTSKSLLPEDMMAFLNESMSQSFGSDTLDLASKGINDSMMPEVCEWIVKLGDKVNELDLDQNQITSVGVSTCLDTLKVKNSCVKVISLSANTLIDDKCMKSLGEYIKSNKNIEIIWLEYTNISDAGIEILAPYFDGNTTFKSLLLNENKGITDKSIPLLMKMFESSCIENVGINNTSITQKNTIYALSACNRIKNGYTRLDLSWEELNDDDLIEICNAMKKYGIDKLKVISCICHLSLEINDITSKGASILFDILNECNSVVSIMNLWNNQIGDECMKQLGEYLQENECVKELKLERNRITDKGIEILSEYLIGNTTLKELNLSENREITDASVLHLIEMIDKSCITILDIDYTSIFEEKKQEIYRALSIPIEEREIPIKSNTKSAAKIQSSSASTST